MSNIIQVAKLYFSQIDRPLFFAVLTLAGIGLLNMYGVAGENSSLFIKQIATVSIGISVMIIISFFNYRYLKNHSFSVLSLYIFSLILLGSTFYSQSIRGTNSWIIFGNLTFEPVELTKLCLIILMAKYFSQRHAHINQFKHIVISGLYFLIPLTLIVNQPDLGSAMVVVLIWGCFLIFAGINKKHLIFLILAAALFSYAAWVFVLEPYQKTRILSFMDQNSDPQGSGYNLIQSKIAIGSGSLFGNGLGRGSQTNLGFLPEPHNDFIFAALAEQFGLFGVTVVMGTVYFIIYRILVIGTGLVVNFSKLFSLGMAVFFFAHVFISAGVNVGLMPVTGIPFPLLSSGGSNLVAIMAGFGVLQSIKRYG